jgi:hypothetical protein
MNLEKEIEKKIRLAEKLQIEKNKLCYSEIQKTLAKYGVHLSEMHPIALESSNKEG